MEEGVILAAAAILWDRGRGGGEEETKAEI